jgi:hypothetical protein
VFELSCWLYAHLLTGLLPFSLECCAWVTLGKGRHVNAYRFRNNVRHEMPPWSVTRRIGGTTKQATERLHQVGWAVHGISHEPCHPSRLFFFFFWEGKLADWSRPLQGGGGNYAILLWKCLRRIRMSSRIASITCGVF